MELPQAIFARHRIYSVIFNGVGAVLKVCKVVQETVGLKYIVQTGVSFIMLSSVNIVQFIFCCSSVIAGA